MDPWLEQYWGDVIASLVTYIRDSLQDRLPQGIRARMQERIVLEYPQWNATRPIYPDVAVVEEEAEPTGAARQIEQSTLVMDEPEIIELAPEPRIETFVEIVDQKNDDQLITVIEVLSPANKQSGLSSQKYLQKQWELMQSGISLVEIDLLRAGTRVTLARAWRVPTEQRRKPYQVSVWWGSRPKRVEVYAVMLNERLPVVSIPLREQDHGVGLDVQAVVEEAYVKGRYREVIDYSKAPEPELSPEGAAWVDVRLRESGLR